MTPEDRELLVTLRRALRMADAAIEKRLAQPDKMGPTTAGAPPKAPPH